jgi:hypothetical protein
MDQKAEIRRSLGELAAAAGIEVPNVDDSKIGPLGLAKALIGGMPRARVVAAAPGFAGSWLDMFACEKQGVAVHGSFILSNVLPPASMLSLKDGTEAEQAILRAGATVSIRPPGNDLLILSPPTAEAAVYEISAAGMVKIADHVAALVAADVQRALRTASLPRFGFDDGDDVENYAVVVAGRRIEPPRTQGAVRRLDAFVRQAAARSGLPLAYVHMGTTINWMDEDDEEEDYESAPGAIGVVLAHASSNGGPVRLSRDEVSAAPIPADFWDALAREHEVETIDEGVFLAPAGWTVARVYDASATYDRASREVRGKSLVTTSSEDGTPGKRLDDRDLPDELVLYATYS